MKIQRILFLTLSLLSIAGCSHHPLDCAIGRVHDDCMPGTAGFNANPHLTPSQRAWAEADVARKECQEKKTRGELKTNAEVVACFNPKVIEAYKKSGFQYMDIITRDANKNAEIAERVDNGEITEEQGKAELAEFMKKGRDEIRQRDLITAKAEHEKETKEMNDFIERTQKAQKESEKQRRKEQLEADKEKCDDYGIKRGTSEFSACLIQLDQARQQQVHQQQLQDQQIHAEQQMQQQAIQQQQRQQNTAAALAVWGNMQKPQTVQPYIIPQNHTVQTNCYGSGGTINCTSQSTGIDTSIYPTTR